VDLSNICISYHECDEHWLKTLQTHVDIIKASIPTESGAGSTAATTKYDDGQIVQALNVVATACEDAKADRVCNAKKFLGAQAVHNLASKHLRTENIKVLETDLEAIRVRFQISVVVNVAVPHD